MSEELDKARDVIARRIADRTHGAECDDLVKLADAYQKIRFGPQGYDSKLQQTQENTTTTTTTQRYEQPERRGAGFKGG